LHVRSGLLSVSDDNSLFGEIVIKCLASVNGGTPCWSAAASQAEVVDVYMYMRYTASIKEHHDSSTQQIHCVHCKVEVMYRGQQCLLKV